jgi:hypothetical protein
MLSRCHSKKAKFLIDIMKRKIKTVYFGDEVSIPQYYNLGYSLNLLNVHALYQPESSCSTAASAGISPADKNIHLFIVPIFQIIFRKFSAF